jgi:hypothetical protein
MIVLLFNILIFSVYEEKDKINELLDINLIYLF